MPSFFFQTVLKIQLSRWIVMFFIGVLTGLTACVIDILIELLSKVKFINVQNRILSKWIESQSY